MFRFTFLTMLCLSVCFSACKKDPEETKAVVKPSGLLYGQWKMTAYTHNNEDAFLNGQIPNCVKDDRVIFTRSNTVINDEGPTKCNPSDPQTKTGPYTYNSAQNTLSVTTDGTERLSELITLDSTTLKIRQKDNNDVITYTRVSFDTVITIIKNIDWTGIWTLDLELETEGSPCDETMLEDEAHITPTFHFGDDGKLYFDTDPVESNLNGGDFSNTYTFLRDTLTIKSYYNDGTETMKFDASLTYDYTTKQFSGRYTNVWNNGLKCSNTLVVRR
ncbi:MAG TPA: lipocalin family protein [Chitinophagaceae bacterium]|nr:lipocalin family protein [Chitinophagaceae bacterium]